jgi:DNA primase
MAFTQEFIERVLEANNIVEIISQHTQLKPQSGGYMGRCPFPDHQEKTASFSVSETKQVYNCFGCHKKGNLISFMRDFNGMGFRDAIEFLADRASIALPKDPSNTKQDEAFSRKKSIYEINKIAAQFYFENLRRQNKDHFIFEYLKKRNLTPETVETFKIGFAGSEWNQLTEALKAKKISAQAALDAKLIKEKSSQQGYYDLFRERLMFPIQNVQGDVLGFGGRIVQAGEPKYLNSPESEVFHKGKILYGLFQTAKYIRSMDEVILVEGYMDLVSLYQQGIYNVAATLGTALTENHARIIKKMTQNVVILFDGDSAGQEAARRSLPILLAAGLRPRGLTLPDELDPDEFVSQNGPDELKLAVKNCPDLFNVVMKSWMKGYGGQVSHKLKIIDLLAPVFAQISDNNTKSLYIQEAAQALSVDKAWIANALRQKPEAKNGPFVVKVNTVAEPKSGASAELKPAGDEIQPQMQVQYQLKKATKAELTLLKLVLSNQNFLAEAHDQSVERFLQENSCKEIFVRALEVSRQTPEKFGSLVSLLTTYIDQPEAIVPDLISSGEESDAKLLRDCILKVKEEFITSELRKLSNEVIAQPDSQKLERILQLQKEKLALRQGPERQI